MEALELDEKQIVVFERYLDKYVDHGVDVDTAVETARQVVELLPERELVAEYNEILLGYN